MPRRVGATKAATTTITPNTAPSTAGHRDGAGIHVLTIRTFTAAPSTTIGTTSVKTWSPRRAPAGAVGSIRWERWSCQAYSPLPGGATSAQSGSASADAPSGIELPP